MELVTQFAQKDVGYDATGKGMRLGFRCGTCVSWNGEDKTCSIVEGRLGAGACCNFWSAVQRVELAQKVSQESAVVVGPPSEGESHSCDVCRYYTSPKRCSIVSGVIDPKATCILWEE